MNNQAVLIPKPQELEDFIEFLFGGLDETGYMYVATKTTDDENLWDQAFFSYPDQVPVAIEAIKTFSQTHEVYMAPCLYKSKRAERVDIKCTQVVWCDFDGNVPESFDIPPSLRIRSSEENHEHTYWKLDRPLVSAEEIEDYNRRLCYKYGADNSGWDATQVLRPPYTLNHKRGKLSVATVENNEGLEFDLAVFDDLAPAPEKTVDYSLWEKIDLPLLNDVIYRNKFGPDFKILFEKSKHEVNDRSSSLTNMAFICAEAGLNDKEIYVIISHLAERWEKFKHHTPSSRARQLIAIIEHTRIKYPHSNFNDFDQVYEYSPKTLHEADIQIEWAIQDMLMARGNMMLAGPSGIGKTQLSMQFMFHLAMGENFLHYEIPEPQKIGFLSLEMGDLELKHFMNSMYPRLVETYSPEKIQLLNQNLKIIPFGEMLPLNTPHGQDIVLQYLEANEWQGLFIDSIGSAILGNISSSEVVQPFTNFNAKLRKRYGCFLWYIHHFRKPAPGQGTRGGQEDIFGDQYLTATATSVYTLTKSKTGLLRVTNAKNRLAPTESNYLVKRELGLTFSYQGEENQMPDPVNPNELLKKQLNINNDGDGNDNTPKFGM